MTRIKLGVDRAVRKASRKRAHADQSEELPRDDVQEQGTRDGKLLLSRRESRHSFRSRIGKGGR